MYLLVYTWLSSPLAHIPEKTAEMSTPSKDSSRHCSVKNDGQDQDVSFKYVRTQEPGTLWEKNAVYKYKRLKNWYFKILRSEFWVWTKPTLWTLDWTMPMDWYIGEYRYSVLALLDCPMSRGLA